MPALIDLTADLDAGASISRDAWATTGYYVKLTGSTLLIYNDGPSYLVRSDLFLGWNDLLATDWNVVT